ncbi:MAG: TlpA disulfide reductase family protein [Mariprofundaceae bacterium]
MCNARFFRITIAAICIALVWAIPVQAASSNENPNGVSNEQLDKALADFGVIKPRTSIPAPDFSLMGLDGQHRSLSTYQGKVVLLHFWATWCVPCRKEMPILHDLGEEHAAQGFELMCVNVDRGNRGAVEEFMHNISQHFHTLLDPDGEVRNIYEVRAFPTSYVIGRDGKIIGKIIGERDWAGVQALNMIEMLLGTVGKSPTH